MKEEIKLFLQKVAKDEELQKKMQACKSPEEAYALASSIQEGFTFEEFADAMQKLSDALNDSQELTDEDLAKAAGGLTESEKKEVGDSVIYVSGGLLFTALVGYVAASSVM